jgi:hypothetical protein
MKPDSDIQDWESVLWFLVAHNLRIDDAHERRLDDLKSTIETVDRELAALTESYISLYRQKRAFGEISRREEKADYRQDAQWKLLSRELDRAIEKFKQRINTLS